MQYFVEIYRKANEETSEKVVERMGPMCEHRAEKVELGANINLNHRDFATRIVEEGEDNAQS